MPNTLQTGRLEWSIVLLLGVAAATLSYRSLTHYPTMVGAIEHTLEVQSAIDGTLSSFAEVETGQRGYVLTGDDAFLRSYEAGITRLPEQLSRLRQTTHGDVIQRGLIELLEKLADDKVRFAAETIRLRREVDLDGALRLVRTGRGLELMESIGTVCRQMRAHSQQALAYQRAEADAAQRRAAWVLGGGSLLMVLLTLFGLLTVHRDMKVLKNTAEELAASKEHFRVLTENSGDLVRLVDTRGKTTYVSPSVERLLGFSTEEFLALPALHLVHPDDMAQAERILEDARQTEPLGGFATYRLRDSGGEYRYFETRWSVLRDASGAVSSLHTTSRDVTDAKETADQLIEQAERLRDLSLRDELTQLYNRRGFMEVASRTHLQAVHDCRRAGLVFIDLNGMKRVNDELGHEVGDELLRDAAQVIVQSLDKSDVVARLGGDEFVAFSIDFDEKALTALQLRLRKHADAQVAAKHRPYRISMSTGAAFHEPGHEHSLEQLLESADQAMYEAKRARRAAGGISLLPRQSSSFATKEH